MTPSDNAAPKKRG